MKSIMLTGSPNNQFKAKLDIYIAILLVACFALVAWAGGARSAGTQAMARPADMKSGSLLLKSRDGGYLEAPRLGSDYSVFISGPTARTVLTQRFANPADGWVEGIYVFPLPESAAVDTLKIVAGNRIIVGEVKEKQEAKIIYEAAKAKGQTAALLEQERPNLFTNSVANIGPHEAVVVQIEYQEAIKQDGGTYSLRLPLVVAPRYNPQPLVQTVDFSSDGNGYGEVVNDPVPDRGRITPAVLDPAEHGPVNPVSVTVALNAGFALGDVASHHHKISITKPDERSRQLTLADGEVPADRDFELTWTAAGAAPQVGLFKETVKGTDYLLATVTPPSVTTETPVLPRETIFVIDNSGSMEGPSMQQAKESLLLGLGKLTSADRFNVIRFDDTYDMLFPTAVPADASHLHEALIFVSSLNANGGTEMVPPMKAALNDVDATDKKYLRQVVFITDGAIGNEQEFFAAITKLRGRSRVFMVGIGSAPNSYLMTRAAELGRGTFTFIGEAAQVKARMEDLFTKIGQPVVTGLAADMQGSGVHLTPALLPDLYRGEPVLMMAQAKSLSGSLLVSGKIGDTPWQVKLPLAGAAPGKGISKLWAHRKVAEIETAATLGEMTSDAANKAVLAVALEHQIVSSQTSLIAVDKTPKRPADLALTRADIPLNLPAGWSYEKVFGKELPLPKTKNQRDASTDAFMQLAVLEKPAAIATNMQQQVSLPQTATPAGLFAVIAALLAAIAAALRLFATRIEKVGA